MLDSSIFATSTTTSDKLVIAKNKLQAGASYTFAVSVRKKQKEEQFKTAKMRFTVNLVRAMRMEEELRKAGIRAIRELTSARADRSSDLTSVTYCSGLLAC
mgnify:CR=1 FL=1